MLKAMGQAISKTVTISEILKVSALSLDKKNLYEYHLIFVIYILQSKVPGLHQDVNISSMSITDVFEPMEEGLVP